MGCGWAGYKDCERDLKRRGKERGKKEGVRRGSRRVEDMRVRDVAAMMMIVVSKAGTVHRTNAYEAGIAVGTPCSLRKRTPVVRRTTVVVFVNGDNST